MIRSENWKRNSVLAMNTFGFTVMFAVWVVFAIVGLAIRKELGLTDTEFAVLEFSSAIAAYGAFFIPRAFGVSMKSTGSPAGAIVGFIVVYLSCIAVTWWFYSRRKAEMPC